MGCQSCGDNTPPTSSGGCSSCGSGNYQTTTAYNEILAQLQCVSEQVEQVKKRTEQNDLYIREVHPDPAPVKETLCPVQTCIPCATLTTGCDSNAEMCTNKSPTGLAVGASSVGSTCGLNSPATLGDKVEKNASNIRALSRRVQTLEAQLFTIRDEATKTILLDSSGMVKGALTLTGRLVSFQPGSWEEVINTQ